LSDSRILVLGAGAWGTALAISLARNGHGVLLWGRYPGHMQQLAVARCNAHYLPDQPFPELLEIVAEPATIDPSMVETVVMAVPCAGLRETLGRFQEYLDFSRTGICLACKGLEPGSLLLNHEVVTEVAGEVPLAVLSGPSFAGELARGLPTAVTIASADPDFACGLQGIFHSETLRIYTHDDVIGVQIGGAIKNVMAIAAGAADGLGFGANTRAALITRGLSEIMRLGVAMGARPETFMGLAGIGDLVLTCTDDQSRNRRFGLTLARGETVDAARAAIGQVVEGAETAAAALALAERHTVEMPITEQVVAVLRGDCTPREAVQALLSRDPKSELET
jgi:glycerol-3-phosphate dehydrogenase (NAD(P)+)